MAEAELPFDAAPEPVAAPEPQEPQVHPTDAAIHQVIVGWFDDLIRDSVLSRETAALNHLTASLPTLEERLAAAVLHL